MNCSHPVSDQNLPVGAIVIFKKGTVWVARKKREPALLGRITSVEQSTDGIVNASQLSIKNCKLTGPSQTIKRRVENLVQVDSALEGLEIDKWLQQLISSKPVRIPDCHQLIEPAHITPNDPVYKPLCPATVTKSDRLLRSRKTPATDHVLLLALLTSHQEFQISLRTIF